MFYHDFLKYRNLNWLFLSEQVFSQHEYPAHYTLTSGIYGVINSFNLYKLYQWATGFNILNCNFKNIPLYFHKQDLTFISLFTQYIIKNLYLIRKLYLKREVESKMQCLNLVYEFICCISRPKFPNPYDFQFSGRDTLAANTIQFESNFVKTSKYTWYSFFPKSLLAQFKRLANIYFLLIAILQTIPIISPLSPVTAWAPLLVVLGISMIRQGYEDFQRYKSDKEMNFQTTTQVRRDGKFTQVQWSKVVIGDICRVNQQELFPADLILFTSSIEGGAAFIETASLDGQKNLKPRNSHKNTIKYSDEKLLNEMSGKWKGIVPDKELHKFSSKMTIGGQTIVYQGDKQLLYRGARLKNTKWVYGLVVYTGRNTKIMMNSESSSQKMSQVQVKVNIVLGIILLFQLILCIIVGILYGILLNINGAYFVNIPSSGLSIPADSVIICLSYLVLLNTMIPISLIVSIQIVKMSQSYFINKDNLMFSQFRQKSATVKTASLNEELGQIQYVFSDKTGTLTMNLMEFKIAVIGSRMYGDIGLILNDPSKPPQNEKGFRDDVLTKLVTQGTGDHKLQTSIQVRGGQTISFSSQKELCQEYLLALATAHEVVADKDKDGKLKYQGPSPDEITLVDAARQMQFQFVKSTQSTTTVKIRGAQKTFELLEVFPFNSDRKRMSVIIKSNGAIKMYTKGADSIVKARLATDQKLNLDQQLTQFSRIGLRTLMIAMKTISQGDYRNFRANVEKLPQENRQKAYDALVSDLEKGLYLIGATAVLDRLQDFVPETIKDLIRANIKVWMLTGDKMQTAENIAKSCNLIQSTFQILRYACDKPENMLANLRDLVEKSEQLTQRRIPKGLLIEGSDLTPILASQEGQTQLANLAKNCQAVVCCRLLPLQKAQVVDVVRKKLNKITLAIGDGANDVPMIKTAHIGVGLFGQEGMGAVQASDYALPQFRMLWRLLLVHGRWNYIRISEMILYFFYKNMLFTLPQFIFAFYCAYSAQSFFDDWFISLYNLVFTSVPLIIRAIFQQDVNYVIKKQDKDKLTSQQHSMLTVIRASPVDPVISRQVQYLPPGYDINRYFYRLFPKIYFIGQQSCIFNYKNYFLWVSQAIVESILVSLFCLYIIGNVSVNTGGYNSDLWLVGMTTFSCVICVVTFKLCTHTKFYSGIFIFCVLILSLCLYLAYMWISNYYITDNIQGTTVVAWTSAEPYLTVLFCICFVLFIDGIVVHIDFNRGGYSSKMRRVVHDHMQQQRGYYEQLSIKFTDVFSNSVKNRLPLGPN